MQSLSKTQGKVHCSSRNLARYAKRMIVYLILTLLLLPTSIALLTMQPVEWPAVVMLCVGVFSLSKLCISILSMLHPDRGVLGKSLLSYTDGTKYGNVRSLFLQIDEDMAANGRKFGYIWVGEEWVLGDEAMRIERIRGIFSIAKWRGRRYEYAICLVDDRRNVQTTNVDRESHLNGCYYYLTGLLPHAFRGESMDECSEFIEMDNQKWEEFNRTYADKQRLQRESGKKDEDTVEFVFQGTDGIPTSRVSRKMMYDALDGMEPDGVVWLTPGKPLPIGSANSYALSCHRETETNRYSVGIFMNIDQPQLFVQELALERAKVIFADYFAKGRIPDLTGWEDRSYVLAANWDDRSEEARNEE